VDWKIRKGEFSFLTGKTPPLVLGGDFSGVVVEVGARAEGFHPGDEVFGLTNFFKGGAYAEFLVAGPENLALKPKNLDFVQAAVMPLVGLTAIEALLQVGHLKRGEHILINGCTGGVGTFALQLARSIGAKVTGVCSAAKAAYARAQGADLVIDYNQGDVFVLPQEYDLIFDIHPNLSFPQIKQCLKPGGRYVSTQPSVPQMFLDPVLNPFRPFKKRAVMVASKAHFLKALAHLAETHQLVPRIEKKYSLKEVAQAHDYSETGRVTGKLALVQDLGD